MPEETAGAGVAAVAEETPVLETPTEEPEVPSTGTPAEVTELPAPEGEEIPAEEEPELSDQEDVSPDGRKIDAKTRTAIAALKKTDPAAAKAVRDAYFSNQAVMKEFPEAKTPGDVISQVRSMKATLEALGGEAGIAEKEEELKDWRNEADQFAAGDPELINKLGEANAEALVINAQNSLDWLKNKNKELFDQALLPSFAERIESAGLNSSMVKLAELIKEGKGQEAYDLVGEVGKWLGIVREQAKKHTEGREKRDPREDDYARREEALDARDKQSFERSINSDLTRRNNTVMSRHVEPLFKQLKLSNEGRREFINGLQSRIWKAMETDKPFQRQAKAIMAKNDAEKAAAFIHAKFNEFLPSHFARYRNIMYPNLGGAKPAPVVNGKRAETKIAEKKPAPAVGPGIQLKEPMKGELVDWGKSSQIEYIAGRAIGKDGKRYSWSVRH